jgi:hypothetical protein
MKFFKKNLHYLHGGSICLLSLLLYGFTSCSQHIQIDSYENVTNTYGQIFLYASWFRGSFGDGQKEWNGLVSDNDLVTGLHPATKSEFDFKVRSYPSLCPQFTNKMDFLQEIAREIEATNKMEVKSERLETISIEQSFNQNGKLVLTRTNFTFLCKEGKVKGPLHGIYSIGGDAYFVHYLADVHSDAETNLSGTVFHAMAFIPETVGLEERGYLVKTMKLFIEEMDLSRDPKSKIGN